MSKSVDPIIQEALGQIEQLEQLRKRRIKENGLAYYMPNKKQYQAHKCDSRTILYCGGNRAGKSTFGATELCYHLTRNYPSWFSKKRRFNRPIKAVISATEFPVVERVIEPKLREYLPADYFTVQRNNRYLSRINCKDGSTVDILTLEMKDEAYESADWDFAWMDEPQDQKKRQAILRGLIDRQGIEVITFTPLTEPWMKEELVDKADGKRISCFTVDMRDNMYTLDGKPILAEEAIKEFEDQIPEDVRESRVHGKFFHLRGLVYKEFSDAHITDFTYEYPDPVICVIDPHDRVPHHVIWAYVDRQDDIHVDYEFIGHLELDDLAKRIKTIEQTRGYKIRKRLIDPNFGRKPARVGTNLSVIQELHANGLACYESNDDVSLGHMIVRDYLHYNRSKDITATNKPKIFFSRERTPETIRSMKNLQYEDWAQNSFKDRDPKEIEKDKENHGADCVRYLLVSKPTHGRLTERIDEYELAGQPY